MSAIKNAAVAGGVVGTGWCAYQIWSLNCKYEEHKKECNNLKSRLNDYGTEIKNKKAKQNRNVKNYQLLKELKK